MRLIIAFLLFFLLLGQQPSYADYPINGNFASNGCEAYSSSKTKSEPVSLPAGQVYSASGLNVKDGDYVSIKVEGRNKWVNKNCGKLSLVIADRINTTIKVSNNTSNIPVTAPGCPTQGCAEKYLLSLSWQSAFCETHPNKAECIGQTENNYDASNFTLHGLWPDKLSYCGVPADDINSDETGNWKALPVVAVDAETNGELTEVMPGVKSNLERHEWTKHGTCDGRDADAYYDIAVDLLKEVNASDVRDLFAQNIGETITLSEVKTAFERTFGQGTAASLNLKCSGTNNLATEIRLKVKRPLPGQKLANLLIPSGGLSCDKVLVDAVGVGMSEY
ncbi:ribonuclease T2 [Trichormus sp. NMC-1]|uniref:ribonuclease T2 n=1 Tax=Trichormus sp. NMC-1 TaxID=1853259 RepID=UPI0008DBF148|nr:ribonuclease T2 [Trichormus sp. NMC-1]